MQIKSQDSALQAKSLESAELSKPYGPPAGSNGFRPASPMISTPADVLSEASHELRGFQAQIGERVAAARESIEKMSGVLVDQARKSAATADGYVHAQPWKAVAIAAAVGVVLGLLLAPRKS